jgi:hypothetical protein
MIELVDDYFAEYPATTGEPDTIDTDEVVTAIAKTVAELTCGQDGTIRQQLIKQLMREIMNYDAEFRSRRRNTCNRFRCTALGRRDSRSARFALRALLSFGRGVWTPIRAL